MNATKTDVTPATLLVALLCVPTLQARAQCTTAYDPFSVRPGLLAGGGYACTLWDRDGTGPEPARVTVVNNLVKSWHETEQRWLDLPPMPDLVIARRLCVAPGGRLFVAGTFGVGPTHALLEWSGSAWSQPPVPVTGSITAMTMRTNGDLVIAGTNLMVGTSPAALATWNGTTWTTIVTTLPQPQTIHSLLGLDNGDLIAAGVFTALGTTGADGVARWDGTTWSSLGTGIGGTVDHVVQRNNGDLLAVGSFQTAGGMPASGVAVWDGVSWSTLGTGVTGAAAVAVELANGDLVVGGSLTAAGGTPVGRIARWDGGQWHPLLDGVSGAVRDLTVMPNGDLTVIGGFSTASSLVVNGIARWDGSTWSAFGRGSDASVGAFATTSDGRLVAGGAFRTMGGIPTNHIAVSADGETWDELGTGGLGNTVYCLLPLANGDIVAGGTFQNANQQYVNQVARWDGTTWNPMGGGVDRLVYALAQLHNGDIVVGGDFFRAGNNPALAVARYDGISWSPLGSGVSGVVFALLVLPNGDLVAGGSFGSASGTPASNIARWNGTAWSPLGSGTNGIVHTMILLADGSIVAAGQFTTAGGVTTGPVARWSGTAWSSLGVNSAPIQLPDIRALLLHSNGDLYVGGRSTYLWPYTASVLRRRGTTWSVAATTNRFTLALQEFGDRVYEGGQQMSTPLTEGSHFGFIASSCPASATTAATACSGTTGPLHLAVRTLPWIGATFRAAASGFTANALGATLVGFGTQSTPLIALHPTGQPGCVLSVTGESTELVQPTAGSASKSFAIPNTMVLVGLQLHHQFVQAEFSGGNLVALSSSNVLHLTIGAF